MKLSERAYKEFKNHVYARELRPGQFVSQRELVALTGVPLGPMREALHKLEAEGLVEMIPQRGIKVADASPKRIRDAFALRILIEKEAARRFASSATESQITTQEAKHRGVVQRARGGIDDALLEHAQAVDWGMHDAMVAALDNDLVWGIHKTNSDRIRLIRLDSGRLTQGNLLLAMEEHLALIAACRRRDPEAAAEAIEAHLSTAMRRAMGL